MSFSHALSGVSDHAVEITDPEAFAANTTTQELKDWDLILDSALDGYLPHSQRLKLNAIGVVGHSRGGSYGIVMAARVPQIQSIVTWGAIKTFERFDKETIARWQQAGRLDIQTLTSGEVLRLDIGALEALERNRARLDVVGTMRSLNIPILLIHGREDRRVPLSEAHQLYQCANAQLSRLHVVECAGHTFRTKHPFTVPSQPLLEATVETVDWFAKTLKI